LNLGIVFDHTRTHGGDVGVPCSHVQTNPALSASNPHYISVLKQRLEEQIQLGEQLQDRIRKLSLNNVQQAARIQYAWSHTHRVSSSLGCYTTLVPRL
jgi:hypothetical protein